MYNRTCVTVDVQPWAIPPTQQTSDVHTLDINGAALLPLFDDDKDDMKSPPVMLAADKA